MLNIPIDNFESWLRNKNLKENTIEQYIYYFNKFCVYDFLNQETLSQFLAVKGNRNLVARAFLVNLRKFILQNHKGLNVSVDNYEDILRLEVPKHTGRQKVRLPNPLTEAEVLHLEKYFKEEKYKVMLLISFYCGLRLGELIKIRVNSFNWQEWAKDKEQFGEVRVLGKGDKEGVAIVPAKVMIRTYLILLLKIENN